MKSLLAKIGLPRAYGLYIDDEAVHLSQVVATPFGLIEVLRRHVHRAGGSLEETLRLLGLPPSAGKPGRRVPMAIGLPARRTYFATRPVQTTANDASPAVLLRESLRSHGISIDQMVADVIKTTLENRKVASIAACEKNYLTGLLTTLEKFNVYPFRVEPVCCALVRAAAKHRQASRNSPVVLRVLLGNRQGLAVLTVNTFPVIWRCFALTRGDETAAIVSTARTLLTVGKHCGSESPFDAVILHGRTDLVPLTEVDWLRSQLGASVTWSDGPGYHHSEATFGLAMGVLRDDAQAFDLARSIKPRPSLREQFPFREIAYQSLLLAGMALFFLYRYVSTTDALNTTLAQCALDARLPTDIRQLEQQKQLLTERLVSIHRFLDGRIAWSSYQRELASSLPANIYLTSFSGVCALESGKHTNRNAGPAKSLVLGAAAMIAENGLVPYEVDRCLDALRSHPLLKRDFPMVELTTLKQVPRRGGGAVVVFTVVCLPKAHRASHLALQET